MPEDPRDESAQPSEAVPEPPAEAATRKTSKKRWIAIPLVVVFLGSAGYWAFLRDIYTDPRNSIDLGRDGQVVHLFARAPGLEVYGNHPGINSLRMDDASTSEFWTMDSDLYLCGFRLESSRPGRWQVELEEARYDRAIARVDLPAANTVDVIFACRFFKTPDGQRIGRVFIYSLDGRSLTQIGSFSAEPWAVPEKSSPLKSGWFRGGWSDVPLERNVVASWSWNGNGSSVLARVKHPSYHGLYSIMVGELEVAGKELKDWPQPVWFFWARFTPGR